MTVWYLDTSAAIKLLLEESESATLAGAIEHEEPRLVAGWLLETELRRVAVRHDLLSQSEVTRLLEGVDLFEMPRSAYRDAGLIPGAHLRSLDALHLATAARLRVRAVVTYDRRMADAAHDIGLTVLNPGADGDDR